MIWPFQTAFSPKTKSPVINREGRARADRYPDERDEPGLIEEEERSFIFLSGLEQARVFFSFASAHVVYSRFGTDRLIDR
jgi:hypothetical protein